MSVGVKPKVDQFDDLYGHLLDKREMARHLNGEFLQRFLNIPQAKSDLAADLDELR